MEEQSRLPSPSGARLSGDDFQHLITWLEALRLLGEGDVERVRFEVGSAEAGVVDDLVVERTAGLPSRYAQIKFAVDDTTPLNHEWFTTASRDGARTPLQRFHRAYLDLTTEEHPVELELITNRQSATADPILKHRAQLDGKLVPRLFASTEADTTEARRKWSEHLEIDEGALCDFLSHLTIRTAVGTVDDLRDRCAGAMAMAGLRGDPEAVMSGAAIIRRLVEEGSRELDVEALQGLITQHGLEKIVPFGTLVIQEIAHSPMATLASASVDWVDLFDGSSPDQRRRTKDPAMWEDVMRLDLRRAVSDLHRVGLSVVHLEGAYRLPTAFVVGFELNQRAGYELVMPVPGGDRWSTGVEPIDAPLKTQIKELSNGTDLAIALAISADLERDVEAYIAESEMSVSKLLHIQPVNGPGRHSVQGAGEALSIAEQTVDLARELCCDGSGTLNVFLAAPRGLAVMLGHIWNRLPSTQVFADLNPGYSPAYLVDTASGSG